MICPSGLASFVPAVVRTPMSAPFTSATSFSINGAVMGRPLRLTTSNPCQSAR
jgi:hypothetical protein